MHKLHLKVGYGTMCELSSKPLHMLQYVRCLLLKVRLDTLANATDQENALLRNILHHLPTCSKIIMNVYVWDNSEGYPGYHESAAWRTLTDGLGGGTRDHPWGRTTRVDIRLTRYETLTHFDHEDLLKPLSTKRPVVSLWTLKAAASVSTFFPGGLEESREDIDAYHLSELSPMSMSAFNDIRRNLPIVGLELNPHLDFAATWDCVAACRHSLARLVLVDIQEDLTTMDWVREPELFPTLLHLKLFRMSAGSGVALLRKIVAPKLQSLEYETLNWNNAAFLLAGLSKTTLKMQGTLNPELRRFVLHVAASSMSWSRVLPVLAKMQRYVQAFDNLKFHFTYRGTIHFPLANTGRDAFNAASAARVWRPMTSMAVTLLQWCRVDWSCMATVECEQLRQLMVLMPDTLPHGLNEEEELDMFGKFFKHFKTPNLQELRVHIAHKKFGPYLDVLFEAMKDLPDLQNLKLGVNNEIVLVDGCRFSDVDAPLPTFKKACRELGIAVLTEPVHKAFGPK